jgi:hypothetical protein
VQMKKSDAAVSFAVIRHNVRTYASGGVVDIVRGKQDAEAFIKKAETQQSPEDRHAGWRYFMETTLLKAGMDPAEATHLRQMELEVRESEATRTPTALPMA